MVFSQILSTLILVSVSRIWLPSLTVIIIRKPMKQCIKRTDFSRFQGLKQPPSSFSRINENGALNHRPAHPTSRFLPWKAVTAPFLVKVNMFITQKSPVAQFLSQRHCVVRSEYTQCLVACHNKLNVMATTLVNKCYLKYGPLPHGLYN